MILTIMLVLSIPTLYFLFSSLIFLNKDDGMYKLKYTKVSAVLTMIFILFSLSCAFVNEELKTKLEKTPDKYEIVNETLYRKIK